MTKSNTRSYDFLVFIGRFQPFHLGHKAVIDRALELSERVLVLAGSAHRPRSLRNPFTWQERAQMIRDAYPEDERARLLVAPLADVPYSDTAWAQQVRLTVQDVVAGGHRIGEPRLGLIGHNKDNTSYYLRMFPEWQAENLDRACPTNATDVRESFLRALAEQNLDACFREAAGHLPSATLAHLEQFAQGDAAADLVEEWRTIESYRQAWAVAPHPPTFVTVDAVVVQRDHILVIRRKYAPGRGRLALPGGFLEPHEWLVDAVARELAEETQIDLSASALKAMIKRRQVFDAPYRSDRGRTITHGFLIEIPEGAGALTTVTASDDAEHAFWVPIADLDPGVMFEDHYDIVQALLSSDAARAS